MKTTFNTIVYIIAIISVFMVFKKCEKHETTTQTKTEINQVKEAVNKTSIKEVDTVYIDTGSTKILKGKPVTKWRDSIIFVDKKNNNSMMIRKFKSKIESNNAFADLDIFSSGEVVHVEGEINFNQVNTTTTITKTKHVNGLFLYGETSIKPALEKFEVGLDFVTKNNIYGVNVEYINGVPNPVYINAKIGFRIFNGRKK